MLRRWVAAEGISLLFSLAIGTTVMVAITYRLLVAPDELRSSVNVIGRMIAWGGQPFGAAVGAGVAGAAGVRPAYATAAAVMLVTGTVAFVALRPSRVTARIGASS